MATSAIGKAVALSEEQLKKLTAIETRARQASEIITNYVVTYDLNREADYSQARSEVIDAIHSLDKDAVHLTTTTWLIRSGKLLLRVFSTIADACDGNDNIVVIRLGASVGYAKKGARYFKISAPAQAA